MKIMRAFGGYEDPSVTTERNTWIDMGVGILGPNLCVSAPRMIIANR